MTPPASSTDHPLVSNDCPSPLSKQPSWEPQSEQASGRHFYIPVTVGYPIMNYDPTTDVIQRPYLQETVLRLREVKQLSRGHTASEGQHRA